ncbi:MAG TPA: SWIM zinc finger family protein [Acidimicrobiales bacterium]|nr:SWIM zinc finger family protein [Acidimicrobiales bacterium]
MSKARRRQKEKEDLSELVSRIEAELSGGSRDTLRRLLAQLAPAQGEDDGEYGDAEFGEDGPEGGRGGRGGRGGGPYGPWDDDDEEEPDPYWWRQRAATPNTPVPVEGGLLARSQRGPIGETWWSQRFLAAVETAMVGGRSTRGRAYARKGQVVELRVEPAVISAVVQGTRPAPYNVSIAMPTADRGQWERILASLASQAMYSATMLAGELPHEIEEVFSAVGVPLFPSPSSRFSTSCTCPDWANPCKHVAAVCYLVAEQFDRDPFALLAWRGRERDEILRRLRELRGAKVASPPHPSAPARAPSPPLSECLSGFWRAGPELASVQIRLSVVEAAGAVLCQLPESEEIRELLGPVYKEMAAAAQKRALGTANLTPAP